MRKALLLLGLVVGVGGLVLSLSCEAPTNPTESLQDAPGQAISVQPGQPLPTIAIVPQRPSQPYSHPNLEQLQRLRVDGKRMVREDGTIFAWQGITAFQLLEQMTHGREDEALAFLDWAATQQITIVRVLAMANRLFYLDPEEGRSVLPALLDEATKRGLYVEVVTLADTRYYDFDHISHVLQIGGICHERPSCLIEIANEPNHETQNRALRDPAYLQRLRGLVPITVPVALGAAHGRSDESRAYFGGDYVTVHSDRSNDEGGWRWVRHAREIQARRDTVHRKFVVSDEPHRKPNVPDQHLALALLLRMYGIGDTFHCDVCRFAKIPTGSELEALAQHQVAWTIIPDDWSDGLYTAGHLSTSPVRATNPARILRAYSSLRGDRGYTLLIRATDPVAQWRDDWRRTLIAHVGLTYFYEVSR